MNSHSYKADRDFLARHTNLIELTGEAGMRVAVSPEWQARVMTPGSFLGAREGPSWLEINRPFIAARKDDPKFNNYGGEDRFWLGPEAGQFGLWFRRGRVYAPGISRPRPASTRAPLMSSSCHNGK